MRKKMTLKNRLMLIIIGGIVFIYAVILAYTSIGFYRKSVQNSRRYLDSYAHNMANGIGKSLNEDMAISRSMAQTLATYVEDSEEERYTKTKSVLTNILKGNPKYELIWISWERHAVREDWVNPFGRDRIIYYSDHNNAGTIQEDKDELDLEGDNEEGIYYRIKNSEKEELSEPNYYLKYQNVEGKEPEQVLVSSVCIPIMYNERFVGMVGADLSLEDFSAGVEVGGYEGAYAVIISNNGTIVAHPEASFINQSVDTLNLEFMKEAKLAEIVGGGKYFSTVTHDTDTHRKLYVSFIPISIGRSEKPWSVGVVVPYREITKDFHEAFWVTLVVALVCLVVISFVSWKILDSSAMMILDMGNHLHDLSNGKIDVDSNLREDDSGIGDMARSINKLTESLKAKAKFSNEIGHGHLDAPFDLEHEEDVLGRSLMDMRDSLRENELIASQRRWVNEGVTKFADLIQSGGEDLGAFSSKIASELVKYINATQVGIFLVNNEGREPFLELKGAYAYDRHKYLEKKIYFKEGLVGQCVLEKAPVYLLDIPQDYLNVTSGLGKTNPTCLLIVPLMTTEEVLGALEIASFHPFEKYQIEFVEKLGESIATSISSVKVAQKTKQLLVQSQEQAEQLRSQEEEMRQNMEELQATQEELSRKSRDTEKTLEQMKVRQHDIKVIVNGIPQAIMVTNMDGRIEDVNKSGEEMIGAKQEEVSGKSLTAFFEEIQLDAGLLGQVISTRLKTAGGDYKEVEVHISDIQKIEGKRFILVFVEM